jgi:hypothetical protein
MKGPRPIRSARIPMGVAVPSGHTHGGERLTAAEGSPRRPASLQRSTKIGAEPLAHAPCPPPRLRSTRPPGSGPPPGPPPQTKLDAGTGAGGPGGGLLGSPGSTAGGVAPRNHPRNATRVRILVTPERERPRRRHPTTERNRTTARRGSHAAHPARRRPAARVCPTWTDS